MKWRGAVVLAIGLTVVGLLVAVLASGFGKDPRRIASPLVGRVAPDFALATLDGEVIRLSSLRGAPVVLNFWATWCKPCEAEHADLQRAAASLEGRARFFGVVYQDQPETIRAWLSARGGTIYPTLVDVQSAAALAYGVYGVPETYVIDAGGTIRRKFEGPVDAMTLSAEVATLAAR